MWHDCISFPLACGLLQDWLSRYGYLPPADPRTSKLQSQEGIQKAIRVMQRFGGVRETGVLGNDIPSTSHGYKDDVQMFPKPACLWSHDVSSKLRH